jgi:PEP-CTERM motif
MNKLAIVAALAAASASNAWSVTYNIGTLPLAPAIYSNTASLPFSNTPFSDIYNFVFPVTGATASASAVSVNVQGLLNITDINVSLFNAADVLVSAGGPGTNSQLFNVVLVPGASYYYTVTGTANGAVGGAYSFIASAAPVPEPETYALMVAGLGIVGFVAARRRNRV